MKLLDWLRGSRLSDDLDPDLTTLFAHRDSQDGLSPARLAQARARVDARLREDERSGSLLRRLALAAVGGGSMWTGLIGVAAAHKAVAVTAGLGLMLGGSVAAETSGVGPAVRTAVTSAVQVQATPEADLLALQDEDDEATTTVDASATAALDASATAALDASVTAGHEQCVVATEHARAVLSGHIDGSFLAQLELPEQAKAGLSSEARVEVESALAALENCGLGSGDNEADTDDEDAQQGPPAGVLQGLLEGAGSPGANLGADLEGDVEAEGEAGVGLGLGLGLGLGVGERPDGAGQSVGAGQR